jgi:hypothetical protein
MKKLEAAELKNIYGGTITGTLINSITKGVNTFLALGRAVGSSIRRLGDGNICPL